MAWLAVIGNTNSFAYCIASVPVAELPPYINIVVDTLEGPEGSGSFIVIYRVCPIVVTPTPRVAASSKDNPFGILAIWPSLIIANSAKAPSSGLF